MWRPLGFWFVVSWRVDDHECIYDESFCKPVFLSVRILLYTTIVMFDVFLSLKDAAFSLNLSSRAGWPLPLWAARSGSLAVNAKLIIGAVSPACQVRRKTHISERHMMYGWMHAQCFGWGRVLWGEGRAGTVVFKDRSRLCAGGEYTSMCSQTSLMYFNITIKGFLHGLHNRHHFSNNFCKLILG